MSKNKAPPRPKVYITPQAYEKMSLWARLGGNKNREFTCFGRVQVTDNGLLYVTDAYLIKHEGSSGGVDGDDADINRLMYELYEKGIDPAEAFRCWVHSHPGKGESAVFLSATDEANIERFMTGEFLVSIVFDSIGATTYTRIDLRNPRLRIEADLEVYTPGLSEEERKAAEKEFEEKSKYRSPPASTTTYPGTGSWRGGGVRYSASGPSGFGGRIFSQARANGRYWQAWEFDDDDDDDIRGWYAGSSSSKKDDDKKSEAEEKEAVGQGTLALAAAPEETQKKNGGGSAEPGSSGAGDGDHTVRSVELVQTESGAIEYEIIRQMAGDPLPEGGLSEQELLELCEEAESITVMGYDPLEHYSEIIDAVAIRVSSGTLTQDVGAGRLVRALGCTQAEAHKQLNERLNH
jgi:hypothetical protein